MNSKILELQEAIEKFEGSAVKADKKSKTVEKKVVEKKIAAPPAEILQKDKVKENEIKELEDELSLLAKKVSEIEESVESAESAAEVYDDAELRGEIDTLKTAVEGMSGREHDSKYGSSVGEMLNSLKSLEKRMQETEGKIVSINELDKKIENVLNSLDSNLEKKVNEVKRDSKSDIDNLNKKFEAVEKNLDRQIENRDDKKIRLKVDQFESIVSKILAEVNSLKSQEKKDIKKTINEIIKNKELDELEIFALNSDVEDIIKNIEKTKKKQSEELNKNAADIEKALGDIDTKIKNIDSKLGGFASNNDISNIENGLEKTRKELYEKTKNAGRINDIEKQLNKNDEKFNDIESRFSRLVSVGKIQSLKGDMKQIQDAINESSRRVDGKISEAAKKSEAENSKIKSEIRDFRENIEKNLDSRIKILETELSVCASGSEVKNLKSDLEQIRKYAEEHTKKINMLNDIEKQLNNLSNASNERFKGLENSLCGFVSAKDIKNIESGFVDIEKSAAEAIKKNEEKIKGFESKFDALASDGRKKLDADIEQIYAVVNEKLESVSGRQNEIENIIKQGNIRIDKNPEIEKLKKSIDGLSGDLLENRKLFASKESIGKVNTAVSEIGGLVSGLRADFSEFRSATGRDISSVKNDMQENYSREKHVEERLKMFALDSDVEKVWKFAENEKKVVNDKMKFANRLLESLKIWEIRSAELAKKEEEFNRKLEEFPEIKLFEERMEKMGRALINLQRHFVASKISEPVVIE